MSRTTNEPTTGVANVVSADASLALGSLGAGIELALIIRIVAVLPITEGCGPPS